MLATHSSCSNSIANFLAEELKRLTSACIQNERVLHAARSPWSYRGGVPSDAVMLAHGA